MKSIMSLAAAAALFAVAAGCASVRICRVGKSMVHVENSNWLLFNFIPLASGNPERPNENDCRFFTNTVNLENNIDLVDYAVQSEGAVGVRDLSSYSTDEYVLFVLLKRHSMHTSAELVLPGDDDSGDVQRIESVKIRLNQRAENPTAEMLETAPLPQRQEKRGIGMKILDF